MLTLKPSDLLSGPEPIQISTTTTNTKTKSIDHHTQNKLISGRSISIPPTKNKNTFDPNTKTKSNSLPYAQIKLISAPLRKSSRFDTHSKFKSFRCLHTKTINFDPTTKTKCFWTPTQKPSQFRSLH